MADPIELSAMGRSVQIGDCYDYTSDNITSLDEMTKKQRKNLISTCNGEIESDICILVDPTKEEKLSFLGVNSHLQASLLAEVFQGPAWFLYANKKIHNTRHQSPCVATVCIHLRITGEKEVMKDDAKQLFATRITNLSTSKSYAHVTHLVTGITYGFHAVFVLEAACSDHQKTSFESELVIEAEKVFSEFTYPIVDRQQFTKNTLLQNEMITCTLYSTFFPHEVVSTKFSDCLNTFLNVAFSESHGKYIPLKLTISPLHNFNGGIQKCHDLGPDLLDKLSMIINSLNRVKTKFHFMVKDPFISTLPHLDIRLREFQRCFKSFSGSLLTAISKAVVKYRKSGDEGEIESMLNDTWNTHLINQVFIKWILARHRELLVFKHIIQNTRIQWRKKEDIQYGEFVELFVFKTNEVKDDLLSTLQYTLELESPCHTWTQFEICSSSFQDQQQLCERLEYFSQYHSRDGISFLTTSNTDQDGAIQSLNSPQPHLVTSIATTPSDFSSGTPWQDDVQMDDSKSELEGLQLEETLPLNDEAIKTDQNSVYEGIYQEKSFQRLAVEFVKKSQMVKAGQPSCYILKSDERVSQTGGLRWFNIGKQLPGNQRAHKVIILMGATGSGKSTLIDGMVNYILGVEWNDDFRFRIVHDGASDQGKSQAHSQTSSVTAYSIHHVEGMKIPYGITIIDTPGYGDTGGVKRDEEITRIITRFLCHPETNQHLDFVNAVCFVASSADSRLTPTQQYILNSATSIFGKDMENHLQLLVTFSDGMPPPVLEAIRQAGVPGLSGSDAGSVRHHKFNNSALFASNKSEQDSTFDGAYWKLGWMSFSKFFEKLSGIPEQSLKQTQLVAKSRIELELSIQGLIKQLVIIDDETDFVKAKELRLSQLQNQLENTKNYEIPVGDTPSGKIPEDQTTFRKDCKNCVKICSTVLSFCSRLPPLTYGWKKILWNKCSYCSCYNSDHKYVWTDTAMKKEYEDVKKKISAAEQARNEHTRKLNKLKETAVNLLLVIRSESAALDQSALRSNELDSDHFVGLIKSRLIQDQGPKSKTHVELLDQLVREMNCFKPIKGMSPFSTKPSHHY